MLKIFSKLYSKSNLTDLEKITKFSNLLSKYYQSYNSSSFFENMTNSILGNSKSKSHDIGSESSEIKVDVLAAYLVPVLFGIIFIVGFLGNSIVILVLVKTNQQTLQRNLNTTNCLLLNLAIADFLFLLFCVPFQATIYSMDHWPFGAIICNLSEFFQKFSMIASVYTMVALSLDR